MKTHEHRNEHRIGGYPGHRRFAWAAVVIVLSLTACNPGADSGRKGNQQYEAGLYEEATSLYQRGIERIVSDTEETASGQILSDLHNNAGAAFVRSAEYAVARDNFVASVATSDNIDDKGRGYYNAGYAAYGEEQKKLAADYFQKALLQEPNNADAKFNYELVMRELLQDQENQEDQSGGEPPPPPSTYAKELKEQAEELVNRRQYTDAATLMADGLAIDPSVEAFREFMDRIDSIIQIEESPPM